MTTVLCIILVGFLFLPVAVIWFLIRPLPKHPMEDYVMSLQWGPCKSCGGYHELYPNNKCGTATPHNP